MGPCSRPPGTALARPQAYSIEDGHRARGKRDMKSGLGKLVDGFLIGAGSIVLFLVLLWIVSKLFGWT